MDSAARFLKALARIKGIVASMGIPAARDRAAIFLAPTLNLSRREAGLMLMTASGRMAPSSYTELIFIPYSNGFMLSFFNRAASEALTCFPMVHTLKSFVI